MGQGASISSFDDRCADRIAGAPEVGAIPGAADKPKVIDLEAMGINVHECESG